MAEKIHVSGPWITQKEIDYVTDAVTNAWYGNHNTYHQRFEKAFAEYIGVKYAMTLPSCTSAIHLALATLGIQEDDEVIVPDLTWIASAAPINYVGAIPVFADVNERNWCLSAESFERYITANTKAVIPVDLYGNMPEWDGILEVAEKHNIAIIEDAAEAIGCEHKGRRAGSLGDVGVFSFHGSKTLTTGEGGMLVTDNEDIYRRASFLRDHGRKPGDRMFFNHEVAFKYKMSSMQAALGLAQIERVDELIVRKREIFDWYRNALVDIDGITMNYEAPDTLSTFWMVTVILDPKYGLNKTDMMAAFDQHNIDTRPFFHPLSSIPAYENTEQAEYAQRHNINAYKIAPHGINLPSGLDMTEEKIHRVVDVLKGILELNG
jgi:perosamine synthetase